MLTLEKIVSELKVNSVNEVVGGRHGRSNSRSRSHSHRHHTHRSHHSHGGSGRH